MGINRELASYFFEEASKAFSFLTSEYSFAGPEFEIEEDINFVFVTFMGRNIAVELNLDEREGDIGCILARVIEGKRATYADAIDENDRRGIRVRESLRRHLLRRGVRAIRGTPVAGLDVRERIKVTLADFAQMLRTYAHDVLDDSPSALD